MLRPLMRVVAEHPLTRGAAGRFVGLRDSAQRNRERRAARRAGSRGTAVVLLYHRVAETSEDPWGDAVAPDRFEAQIESLCAEMRVMSLAELTAAADRGSIPERAVAISFDDGYVDNLVNALPILERHQAPATLFVAAGFLGRDRQLWWDELADLLLGPGERPARIDVRIGAHTVVAPTGDREQRVRALRGAVHPALRALPPTAIDAALDPVREWAGRSDGEPSVNGTGSSAARAMSATELERLAASPLIELGAHTLLHPWMPAQPAAVQVAEAERSRSVVGEFCERPPRFFAYPFGAANRRSEQAVRGAGFEKAFGTQGFVPVTAASRRFRVPRMAVAGEEPADLLGRVRRTLAIGRGSG